MVNVGRNALSQGEFYPSRENWPRNERQYMEIQDGRFNTPSVHGYPQVYIPAPIYDTKAVEHALRECAQIPVKEFALIVMQDNGEQKTYSSTSLKPHWPKIFTERFKRDFHQCARWANAEGSYPNSVYGQEGMYDLDFDSGHEYRRQSASGESSSEMPHRFRNHQSRSVGSNDDQVSGKRKRTRYLTDENTTIPPVQKFQHLVIGDDVEVEKFYFLRFKDLQQSSCKVMAKAFVKLVEPKKQTHHPYTKGAERAPPWWPPLTGENAVKHKEPDHLYRPERIRLLIHILRIIVQPNHKQHEAIQKHDLNVKALEEVTWEAASNWFNDKEHPENAAKRPFLKEIFKVAKFEERYRHDGTATVPIMYGERGVDDSDDDEEGCKEEDDENENTPASSPESSPTMMQAPQQHSPFETDNQTVIQQRTRPLIVSRHSQQPHMEDQTGYLDTNFSRSMGGYQTQSPNLQQEFRRSFNSTGFPSPQQNMYSGSAGWQNNNMLGSSSMSTNYCVANSSQATLAPSATSFQLPPVPHVQQQQPNMLPPPMTHHTYNDGLPNPRHFDSGTTLGIQLRTGSMGHPHHMSQGHGFGDFMQDGSSFGTHDPEMKQEQHIRPS
ncbi:Uncharacterized protein LSUB1_G008706 [Lachnellula subtilissima]|uniref:Subtelomeric hrmA-associated cluster protein AFUB-079030/YDR124W-like helical bundle domain-containing protein n=1 Tax=Lachnellula subtilissima TaxID=602034 RepID=A0A8H8U3B6_9HELO|nr:Uncharacterized protein LSUB1_G008706 [Lachnellula subtilissima]